MDDFDASDLSALFAEVDELQARGRAPQKQCAVSPAVRLRPWLHTVLQQHYYLPLPPSITGHFC